MSGTQLAMPRLVRAAVAAIVALLALSMPPASVSNAHRLFTMAAVGPAAPVSIGSRFDVKIDITEARDGWAGFQVYLVWDHTKLSYVGSAYTHVGGTTLDADPVEVADGVQFGTARASGSTTATGTVAEVTLQCNAAGVVALHLETLLEDPSYGTTVLGPPGYELPDMDLVDGMVTCAEVSDIAVTKTHTPEPMIAGSPATYTATVTNLGP